MSISRQAECVVLLHGLARTSRSMKLLQSALEHNGYQVCNINYPSTQMSIAELSEQVLPEALEYCRHCGCHHVSFITHSMGGILVRFFQRYHGIAGLHRVVMLGPPNKGSEVVDSLRSTPAFKWINGPAGCELGTSKRDTPNALGPVDFELGVIAGTQSISPFLSSLLPAPHDGKVSVVRTQIEGMKDFITLPVNHTFMMRDGETIRQCLCFLGNGQFDLQQLD